MGADFVIAHAAAPRWREKPVETIDSRNVEAVWAEFARPVVQVRIDALLAAELAIWREEFYLVLENDERFDEAEAWDPPAREALERELLGAALLSWARDVFCDHYYPSRDVGWIFVAGTLHVVTGGLSTGDDPTEAYEAVQAVGLTGIYDDPLDGAGPVQLDQLERLQEVADDDEHALLEDLARRAGILVQCGQPDCTWVYREGQVPDVCEHCQQPTTQEDE